jgi:TPP-dependent pyruvate/acetoin dehydrogenase alpha subunit
MSFLLKKQISKIKKKLYFNISLIRETEQKIAKEYENQEMRCPIHLSLGQEASAAAIGCLIKKNDSVFSNHRCHAHYLVTGGNLKKMIAEIYGKNTGCSHGLGGSMHLVDENVNFMGSTAIVSNSIPVAVGYALGNKIKNRSFRTFAFFGDGAVEEGVAYESVNFAILKKLNIVFICENNEFSVYTHINERQLPNRKIHSFFKAMGLKTLKIISPNPFEIYIKSLNFLKKNQNQPVLIEIDTYRELEHCGPNNDDRLNYRSSKKVNFWKKNNAKSFFDIKKYFLNNLDKIKIQNEIMIKVNNAFKHARMSKPMNIKYISKFKNG